MSKPEWKDAPLDAEAFGPKTKGYKSCWYKTSNMGQWYFMEMHKPGWRPIQPPTKYRQRQMERRP